MKNMFNVTTVLPHNLSQTNPCIRHNLSTQIFRKRAAQTSLCGPWAALSSFGGQKMEARKCSAAHGPHSEVAPRAFWRLVSKFVTNARVRLQEVVRQNGGHIEHVLHYEQFFSLWGLILYQMSNVFIIIKMCYVHNQCYEISCATLYFAPAYYTIPTCSLQSQFKKNKLTLIFIPLACFP